MKKSITQYPRIYSGIKEQEEWLESLHLTVASLEATLDKPEYAAIPMTVPTVKHWNSVLATVERTTGFGMTMGNAFERLTAQLGRLPTQAEFNAYCMPAAKDYWERNKAQELPWNDLVEIAVKNRNDRTWVSQLVELHAILLIKELFPDWKVYSSDELDMLLGVDIIVETDKKRLYFHVMKNSPYSYAAFRKKEYRGGHRNTAGKYVKFHRDFTGDKLLTYCSRREICSDSTVYINGIPRFKPDWLETQLLLFNRFNQIGEPLEGSKKLEYMETFLENLIIQEVA